jgi:hypothetical protein
MPGRRLKHDTDTDLKGNGRSVCTALEADSLKAMEWIM